MNLKQLIIKAVSEKPLFINQIVKEIQEDNEIKEEAIRDEVFKLLKENKLTLDYALKVTTPPKPIYYPPRKKCLQGHIAPYDEKDNWDHPESIEYIDDCRCHKYLECKNCGASHGYTFV